MPYEKIQSEIHSEKADASMLKRYSAICRLRINNGSNVISYSAIGNPTALENAAYKEHIEDRPYGITVMVQQ